MSRSIITDSDLRNLIEEGCSAYVVRHCVAVAEKALEIVSQIKIDIDIDLVKKGALHHDIGRSRTQSLEHCLVGAQIAQQRGFEEEVVRIIERHIGAGIPRSEAEHLGLPSRDYVPETPEEIIVAYADNLARGERILSFQDALDSFEAMFGKGHPAVERFVRMHDQIERWKQESVTGQ